MANPSKVAYVTNTTNNTSFDNDLATDISYTSAAHDYLPVLYSKKALKNFYAQTIFDQITNTDYEGQFKSMGDSIKIRKAPTFSSRAYTKGATLVYDTPAASSTSMDIDQAEYIAATVDDIDSVVSDLDLLNMYAEEATNTLRVSVDTNVLLAMSAGVHASNTGATAGAISSNVNLGTDTTDAYVGITRLNALDKLVEMCQVIGEQNIDPMDQRYVVIPEWYATRLKLSDLKAADFTGDSSGVVRSGLIGSINGAKVFVSNNLPDTSTTSNSNYAVLAGVKMATSFAMQISKVERLKAESSFGEKWRTLWVYGRKVVRPEGVAVMYCRPA